MAVIVVALASLGGVHRVRVAAQGQGAIGSRTDAILLPEDEFKRQPVERRRLILNAWSTGTPETAGAAILPMLTVGLRDRDALSLDYALAATQRVLAAAAIARPQQPGRLDPVYVPVKLALKALLADPSPATRRRAVIALAAFGALIDKDIEAEIIRRMGTEPPEVRRALVDGIAASARQGSATARLALVKALEDESRTVKQRVIAGLRALRPADAVPLIKAHMAKERNARIRAELQALVDSLAK